MTSTERKKIRQLEKDIKEMKKENRRIFGDDYEGKKKKSLSGAAADLFGNLLSRLRKR